MGYETEIRRRFWIIKGQSLVRIIIHWCVTCCRFEGTPFLVPPPHPLPISRVKRGTSIQFHRCWLCWPLDDSYWYPNKSGKAWICLFTCFVTRAVHLDIVLDISTEKTFIRCLKRFAAQRGLPVQFISDNGKTFQAASRFFKGMERMVQSTKQCLLVSKFYAQRTCNCSHKNWIHY